MGVALYIQGYEKKEEAISGEIKMLGWYEVKVDEMEKYSIDGLYTVIHYELYSIKHVVKEYYIYGFDSPGELTFYFNIMNSMTGGGLRYEDGISYGIMFDGKKLLLVINKILNYFYKIPLNPNEKEIEKENLLNVQKVLEIIADKDGIVGMVIG